MPDTTSRRRFLGHGAGVLGLLAASGRLGRAQGSAQASAEPLITKAVAFLKPRQGDDGGWSTQREPGITALVVTALLRSRQVGPGEPVVTKALGYLEQFINPNGVSDKLPHSNYSVAIALLAFQEAESRAPGRYKALVKTGQDFLKGKQWDESEGKGKDSDFYGGAGYGGSNSRPDLSNTAFMMEALRDTGLPADDPALQKALVFVSRCQNLKSEFNDRPWAGKVNDGGFVYTAANGGQSMAGGKGDDVGGLRSYASMTYAGLKSMIYAGLKEDDPRVKAAVDYIRKHYAVDENPGLGQAGLYYYYQTFAKALALLGKPTLVDDKGTSHDWRADLIGALAKRQNPDGSWVNKADRFMEGDPNLVTSYGLLALAYARPKAP
ncbi:MAG TPA: prenyltransferase/squalene oxidase repeat-containing protein [Isosphaeraceae bacterium]|nr:prenyltransferase/squalene oxidase repeat-containing protein [Isosphaeraceae bacterium]